MNECDQECLLTAGADTSPISLDEAVARYEKEAQRQVFAGPRYRMAYAVWGNGPPLVLVHGAADTSRTFVPLLARLSARFRCIAYDLPGQPGDRARLSRYRHEHLVDDLVGLLDHLGLARAYALGSSFGSTIVLRAMRAYPSLFPRGIVQGGFARRPLKRAEWWATWLIRWLPGRMRHIPRREKFLRAVHGKSFAGRGEEWWRAFVDWTGGTPLATLGHQGQMLHRIDLREELPHIRQPVLILGGEDDPVMPMRHAEELRQGLPSGGLMILGGCGHLPAYTHTEMMAEVVRQFLTPPSQAACPMIDVCHGHANTDGKPR
ncbi:MAG: alpha/beta hydrolase [Gemmataceae bacterium]|nr:alpha/beta hydrolase [Gemmataceae bacterium]